MGIVGKHPGEILDEMPDHRARAAYCLETAEGLRNAYYRGRRRFMAEAMSSTDATLKDAPESARKVIGQRRWSNTMQCKDLISQEQMWGRWATMYATLAQLDRVL
jgi:hypothetical protein